MSEQGRRICCWFAQKVNPVLSEIRPTLSEAVATAIKTGLGEANPIDPRSLKTADDVSDDELMEIMDFAEEVLVFMRCAPSSFADLVSELKEARGHLQTL